VRDPSERTIGRRRLASGSFPAASRQLPGSFPAAETQNQSFAAPFPLTNSSRSFMSNVSAETLPAQAAADFQISKFRLVETSLDETTTIVVDA
jgi:hypothetical protein